MMSRLTSSITMDMHNNRDFSGYTTTPSSDDEPAPCNWNHWSPLVNWEAVAAPHDDFHHLIDSIMDDSGSLNPHADEPPTTTTSIHEDDTKGVRVVHLLMGAAESLSSPTNSRELARVILLRLKELLPLPTTNMERLAVHFTHALCGLIEVNNTTNNASPTDTLAAFQLLQDMSPYLNFAHFTSNQAILEALAHHSRLHIVDYDIMEGIQWASLMQALASNKTAPHLRITALSRTRTRTGRRSIASVQETGRRLTAFAASLGQPFSFHQCRLDPDEMFRPNTLKLVRGEALVFNCMLNLPHQTYRTRDSVVSFLNGAKSLRPTLVTLVEEDGLVRGDVGFLGQFMDSLHHYSAFYDSLEAGFPMQGRARALVERVFIGPRIAGSLTRMYRTSGEDVERGSWWEWLDVSGFKGVPVSFANHLQAKLLLSLFNDGYMVEESRPNKLVLGWRSRPLLSVSLWTSSSDS